MICWLKTTMGSSVKDAAKATRGSRHFIRPCQMAVERATKVAMPTNVGSRIKSGACDTFGLNRATLFSQIEHTLARAASVISDRQRGQSSLFGAFEDKAAQKPETVPLLTEWPQHELLAHEKELLGFYVTGHPLTPYAQILEKYTLTNTTALPSLENRSLTRIGGLIAAVQNGISKKNGKQYVVIAAGGGNKYNDKFSDALVAFSLP